MVICTDDQKHGLSDGDKVIFSEVQGMTELNNMGPVEIKVRGECFFTKDGNFFPQVFSS